MLPSLVGIIILFGQMDGRLGFLDGLWLLGLLRRCYRLLSDLGLLYRLSGRKLHATHFGQLAHLALDFIGNDIRGILLTQAAGNEQ